MSNTQDGWVTGATYDDFMGRWSRQLAPRFVGWLDVPPGADWLDVGCGTGALTAAICESAFPASVLGCDPAAPFVEYAREQSTHESAEFRVAGTGSLPVRPDGYGCVSSLLALNFFPDPPGAVREMAGLTRSDGTVAACVWDYAGRMEFLRYFWDAVTTGDPDTSDQDEGVRFPICNPDALSKLFGAAGLSDVACEAIDIPTRFEGFDDYWKPLLGGTGPAAAYVTSLAAGKRDELARTLARNLPRNAADEIDLIARAWAVRGRVIR